jgi:hypothetical protein
VKKVNVNFGSDGSTNYTYGYDGKEELKAGDIVLLESSNAYGLPSSGFVSKNQSTFSAKVTKEIMGKVDFSDFNYRKGRRIAAEHIQKQLDEKVKEFSKTALLDLLVMRDPEAAKLVDELSRLKD